MSTDFFTPGWAPSPAPATLSPDLLPAGLICPRRVTVLVDGDALSHGLAEGTGPSRSSCALLNETLGLIHRSASRLGHVHRIRIAASTETARHHQGVLLGSANNIWAIRRGLDGADAVLIDELEFLSRTRVSCGNQYRVPPASDLVLLVGQDHSYAPAVRQLRLFGVPTWVLKPGRFISADLYKAALAVTALPTGSVTR